MRIGGVILSAYLLSIVGTVLLSAIFTAILPEGKTSTLIRSILRMVCILSIISPIISFFQEGGFAFIGRENSTKNFAQTGIELDFTFINYYSEMRIEQTENALEKELYESFHVECTVEISWRNTMEIIDDKYEDRQVEITQIRIKTMQQVDEEVLKNMWEYLTKNYCSEVLIE